MRNIKKDFDNPPAILLSDGCLKKIQEALIKKIITILAVIITEIKITSVKFWKYCMITNVPIVKRIQRLVPHYKLRTHVPKIKFKKRITIRVIIGWDMNGAISCWLICSQCNGKSAKSNKFPIAPTGIRVTTPPLDNQRELNKALCRADSQLLLDEKPLLLNPEIDKPEEHLVFLPNGQIKGITQESAG